MDPKTHWLSSQAEYRIMVGEGMGSYFTLQEWMEHRLLWRGTQECAFDGLKRRLR